MNAPARGRYEWPTIALAVVIYAGWLGLTCLHASLPAWAIAAAGGWLVAWQGSLQHETIHGHPTPSRRLNALIGGIPLSLWLPYAVYRRSHLAHHRTPAITDPLDDPESRYVSARESPARRWLATVEATLLGRLLVGPPSVIVRFIVAEAARATRHPVAVARDWLPHILGVAAILLWLAHRDFAVGRYVLLVVLPGTALTLLRSFAEHRAADQPGHRVAIIETRGPLALLYLNNNLHAAHHRAPGLAWYRLPAFHAQYRAELIAGNGGLLYKGYGEVAARYLLRAHDQVVHPDHR